MLDIVKVMLDFYSCIINTGNITMINLRPARNSWLHDISISIKRNDTFVIFYEFYVICPRPNKAHLAFDYI